MKTDPSKRSAADVLAECALITTHVTSPTNPFNLSAGVLSAIAGAHDTLATAVGDQKASEALTKQKTKDKNDALREAASVLSAAAKTALASGASDGQLFSIGLARPAKPVRPTALPAPTGLTAVGSVDGAVRLAWDRNGNIKGTTFAIEASADGVSWSIVDTTTRASFALYGFAPGKASWFRATAKRSGLSSLPSATASIYAPADAPSAVRLRVA